MFVECVADCESDAGHAVKKGESYELLTISERKSRYSMIGIVGYLPAGSFKVLPEPRQAK